VIIWYILAAILYVVLSCEYYAFKTGVPTLASFPSACRKIIDVLKKSIKTQSSEQAFTIVDLGSGSGYLTWKIARVIPKAHVIGIEISYFPWLRSVIRQRLFGPRNLKYKRLDFWEVDCSQVDAVIIYLTENIIERVGAKLRTELKKGALIIANDTALRGDWEPTETIDTGFFKMKIFVYYQQ